MAALLLVALGCGDATAPLPDGSVAMTALPSQYAFWWQLTEQCSGLTGDLSAIKWYVAPGQKILNAERADGIYYIASHRIVLAGAVVDSGQVVRHEMLHALLGATGHPAQYFQDRCGGYVDCESDCIRDGGVQTVDSAGAVVDPRSLTVMASVDPRVPLQSDSSWVALIVTIKNPLPYAVRVHLQPIPSGTETASETFGFTVVNCAPPSPYRPPVYDWVAGDSVVLAAGATKVRLFDVPHWSTCRILSPYFNSRQITPIRIQPAPPANEVIVARTLTGAHD